MILVAAITASAIGLLNLLAVALCCAAAKQELVQEEEYYEPLAFPGQRNGEIDGLADLTRAA